MHVYEVAGLSSHTQTHNSEMGKECGRMQYIRACCLFSIREPTEVFEEKDCRPSGRQTTKCLKRQQSPSKQARVGEDHTILVLKQVSG